MGTKNRGGRITRKSGPRGGRPPIYNARVHPTAAKALSRIGYGVDAIAEAFGVSRDTIYRWAKKYPEFSGALREGRALADAMVEDALFRRAIGYDVTEQETTLDPTTGKPSKVRVMRKHVPPDVGAIKFWLTNRRPELWRCTERHEHSGPGGSPIEKSVTENRVAEADGFDYERFAALFRQQSGFPPEAKVPDPIEVQNMIARSTRRNGYGQ